MRNIFRTRKVRLRMVWAVFAICFALVFALVLPRDLAEAILLTWFAIAAFGVIIAAILCWVERGDAK